MANIYDRNPPTFHHPSNSAEIGQTPCDPQQ
jgi:hypothetical protein